MKITAKKILELNQKYNLIQGLSERELYNPEGVGFNLRAGEIYELVDGEEGFLGITERKTPNVIKIADIKIDGNKKVMLGPGKHILVKTIEMVNIPSEKIKIESNGKARHVVLEICSRSTLQRCGIYLKENTIGPDYNGNPTFALVNLSDVYFTIELGARFTNVTFSQVIGNLVRSYEGQWNQGRVSTSGFETQN